MSVVAHLAHLYRDTTHAGLVEHLRAHFGAVLELPVVELGLGGDRQARGGGGRWGDKSSATPLPCLFPRGPRALTLGALSAHTHAPRCPGRCCSWWRRASPPYARARRRRCRRSGRGARAPCCSRRRRATRCWRCSGRSTSAARSLRPRWWRPCSGMLRWRRQQQQRTGRPRTARATAASRRRHRFRARLRTCRRQARRAASQAAAAAAAGRPRPPT
jgi:hypothetical protein